MHVTNRVPECDSTVAGLPRSPVGAARRDHVHPDRTAWPSGYWGLLVVVCTSSAVAQPAGDDVFRMQIRPILAAHCFKCHGPDTQESDLRLDTLSPDFSDNHTAGIWVEVRDNVNLGEMPPVDESRPTAEQQVLLSRWIQGELRAMRARGRSTGGRALLRRLTRTEYANTVRDLLKVTFVEGNTPNDLLPPDGSIDGFDKLGKALLVDPSLVEKYFEAGRHVADRAVRVKPPRVPTLSARFEYEKFETGARSTVPTETGVLLYERNVRTGSTVLRHPYAKIVDAYGKSQFPISGRYAIRVRAGADRGNRPDEPVFMDVTWTNSVRKRFEVDAPIDRPEVYEWILDVDTSVNGELQVRAVNGPRFENHPRESLNVYQRIGELQRAGDDRAAARLRARARAEGTFDVHFKSAPTRDTWDRTVLPRVFLDWIELEGPLQEEFPPASTRYVLHEGFDDATKHTPAYARAILARLLPRAFRRPVGDAEVDLYTGLVAEELELGHSFPTALRTGLVAMLCSPDFLFILEPSPDAEPRDLNDFELASRLSYLLWSSMPDEELFDLARNGRLADPDVLTAQVDRLLEDPRSEGFVTDFARQWLKVDEFGKFIPDQGIYQSSYYAAEFGGIGPDMEEEAFAFFREVLHRDESVRSFLDSNWVVVNERLAGYYGLEGVEGERFRRVPLPADSPRGGLLGMAGVHKWGSDGNRTKPVERGKYLLTVLFNDPPDPPPPNAGEVEPDTRGASTVRERLLAHQKVEACAGCHRTIDPYGLAMENWNAVGRWRDVQDGERPPREWRNPPPIVNEGSLPNGRAYTDYESFKGLLVEQSRRFERGLAEKLAVYALGRTLEPTDDEMLDSLVDAMAAHGHTLRSLLKAIVRTPAFRMK